MGFHPLFELVAILVGQVTQFGEVEHAAFRALLAVEPFGAKASADGSCLLGLGMCHVVGESGWWLVVGAGVGE